MRYLLLAVAFLFTCTVQGEMTIDALVEQMATRMQAVRTIEHQTTVTISFQMEEDVDEIEQVSSLLFQRPDHIRVVSEMMVTASDGENLTLLFPSFGYYLQFPLVSGLADALEQQSDYIGGLAFPDVAALISGDPEARLKELLEELASQGVTLTVVGEGVHDGRASWRVMIQDDEDDGMLADGVKVWIDQKTGLLSALEAEVDLAAQMGEAAVPGMPASYRMAMTVQFISVNEELDAARFEVDTEDLTRLEDFDELSSMMQGEMGMPDTPDLLNEPAPDFELTLLDGDVFRLAEQRGRVVLIDFWATWCPPCVESLPYLQSLHERWAERGVTLIGISVDQEGMEDRVRAMLKRFGITYPVGMNDDGALAMTYGAVSIPMLVVVDAEGLVRHVKVGFSEEGMQEVESILEDLVAVE